MVDNIPTEADWRSEQWGIDTPYAYKNFGGKSFEEAVDLFKDNALAYQEDVMFMPLACFPFYAKAYMAYLMSDASEGDSDGASCFFGLIEIRAEEIILDGQFSSSVEDMLEHLAARQEWYDADKSIYGNFSERAQKVIGKLQSHRSGT